MAAVLRECPPDSAEAAQVVNRILEPFGGRLRREELLAGLEAVTDPRIEQYWQLTATINGWPPFRPTCRETCGCSPRCAPTGDRPQTAAWPARHAAGSRLAARGVTRCCQRARYAQFCRQATAAAARRERDQPACR